MKIHEALLEDEGEYSCEALNSAGHAITSCFVQTTSKLDDFLQSGIQISRIRKRNKI